MPFRLTLQSLFKARLIGLMIVCALLAVVIVVLLVVGITALTGWAVDFETPWVDKLFNWATGLILGVCGWFMLPVLTVLVAGMFQETVIHRVERAFYPQAMRKEAPAFWPDAWHDVKFTLLALVLNLLVLPFYLLGIGFAMSIALNSYLIGREFFESAAGHHLGKAQARQLGRRHWRNILLGGLILTLLTLVPLVNLFIPIIAVVWMTHVYHHLYAPEKCNAQ